MGLRPANAQDVAMSVIASHSPPHAAGGTLGTRVFANTIQRTLSLIQAWRIRMRQRSELLMLDAVELRELSLTEADIDREASKPFWASLGLNDS
jgi:uncharacterized protein YjiS (DUF1127 family)